MNYLGEATFFLFPLLSSECHDVARTLRNPASSAGAGGVYADVVVERIPVIASRPRHGVSTAFLSRHAEGSSAIGEGVL